MGQTVVERIVQEHLVEGPGHRPVRAGDFLTVRPRHVLTHDNTAPVMSKFLSVGGSRIHDPRQPVFVLDHDIQNSSPENLAKYRSIERFAREQEVDFYPAGSGIGHQVMVEQLYAVPGALVVAADSHANMYGALGALGTPVVRTDAAAIWASGIMWWQVPPTIQVALCGRLPPGATGKDVIIALCGLYHEGEVLNAALEFCGSGVAGLTQDERFAIANMSTEWGALCGWFPVDETTLTYLRARAALLGSGGARRAGTDELRRWQEHPPLPDSGAGYAGRIELDLSEVSPHVSGPDTVHVATPLAEIEHRRIRIQKAYLVSCVNSRLEDLAAAAAVLKDREVASGVELYIAAASREVQREAERSGDWQTLLAAGARPLPPGCGPCIGLGAGLLRPGEVGISATNRNFKGRMGSRDAECYLASPAVVAASAAAGYISAPGRAAGHRPRRCFTGGSVSAPPPQEIEVAPGFPRLLGGRLVLLLRDNIDTDGIYGKDYTYRDGMTPAQMAEVIFENHEPGLSRRLLAGDVILGGWNFGTGSSREQAVTALCAAGIRLIVAGSFSQTYLRNAFNHGLPCLVCPALLQRAREAFAGQWLEKAIITDEEVGVDFAAGTLSWRGEPFRFPPLGRVPQALIAAGGLEPQLRRQLGVKRGVKS